MSKNLKINPNRCYQNTVDAQASLTRMIYVGGNGFVIRTEKKRLILKMFIKLVKREGLMFCSMFVSSLNPSVTDFGHTALRKRKSLEFIKHQLTLCIFFPCFFLLYRVTITSLVSFNSAGYRVFLTDVWRQSNQRAGWNKSKSLL